MIFFAYRLHVTLNGGLVFLIIDVITALNMNCTSPHTTLINEDTSLNCYIEQLNEDEVLSVIWEKGTRELIKYPRRSIKKKETEEAKFALAESHIHQGDISLTIKNVLQSDEGNYWYSLRTKRESLKGAVKLRVLVRFEMKCPSPQTAFLNMNTSINCTIENLNSDKVTYVFWTKDDNILASYPRKESPTLTETGKSRFALDQDRVSQGDVSLYISDVQNTDGGLYRYSLETESTRKEGGVMLEIFFPKVTRSRTSTVVTVCAVVTILACVAVAAFFFFKQRGTTNESARNQTNLQLEVHEAQDEEPAPLRSMK
ncbi:uncharacterized protein LOC120536738 [Polypterus senegalus]|uniref:uncharacterized protein LOC120536738 n=1 Tax=Polypterus senegalus TaxID=55291 RepID=UPI001964E927|nr:uncharacterized protein LOC120536738 [Polypterus senegalus]